MPITIPNNLPDTPGQIETIFNANSEFLYSEFSPFTNGQQSGQLLGGILSDQQPFVYTTIDQGQTGGLSQLPSVVQDIGDIVGINQDSVNDVTRVSKFLASSWGVQFLATQVAIQRLAPFDEIRVYNPLSPLLATVQPMTLGFGSLPVRHVEGNISGDASAPPSTVGDSSLPTPAAGQGKGLIRGGDANSALTTLQSKWVSSNGSNGTSGLSGLLSSVGSTFNSFFGNPQQSPGTYRADEQTADLMYNSKIVYITPNSDNALYSWLMPWYNDDNTGQGSNSSGYKLFPNPEMILDDADTNRFQYQQVSVRSSKTINDSDYGGQLEVGYTPAANGGTYGDSIYLTGPGVFTNSDILVNFADYVDPNQEYTTKLSNPNDPNVQAVTAQLQNIIKNIQSDTTVYNATSAMLSALLPTAFVNYDDVNNLTDLNNGGNGLNSTEQEYIYGSPATSGQTIPKAIDETYKRSGGASLRMATSFLSDGINLLDIVPSDLSINSNPTVQIVYPGWTTYSPYDDDLIAFYFYDVVNSNFIPFRATVKGISEGNTAFWDELRFIGRADQLYSYNGFSRTLTFTFNVVISSVAELMPTWKKINYMASSVKPSNYTHGQSIQQLFDRFIVPPMFMVTIGDLYRFQPIIITSLNVNIPDDASWETLNEINAPSGWSYLNGIISSPTVGKNYGQLPREAEIAVTCNLLEKERATVGGSHFGHEPRVDSWESLSPNDRFLTTNDTFLPPPTLLHKRFVEWNDGSDAGDDIGYSS